MPSNAQQSPWYWSVFWALLTVMLIKNLGWGVFLQMEEMLLLPGDDRGQTIAVFIGWPLPLLSTEAYTFDIDWVDSDVPVGIRALYALINVSLALLLSYTATKYVSACWDDCGWRMNIAGLLAIVAVCATLVNEERGYLWYQHGVGAASAALIRCVEAAVWLCILATWYWLFAGLGNAIFRLAKREK
jgi:hypothetical protein